MLTAKVTSKGQLTIPKEVRDKLGIKTGETLRFEEKEGIFFITKSLKRSPFDRWVGRLKSSREKSTDALIDRLRGGT
jgi:antitoxin PrlF